MVRVLGLVTARGGSKGIPGKNLAPLAGKPLIEWTLAAARASSSLDRTIVSTDDEEIAEFCRQQKVEVPFVRPAELARDDSPHLDVVLHALEWLDGNESYLPDYVMLLQPTSPLRIAQDINEVVRIARRTKAAAVASVAAAHDHPYWVRRLRDDGTLSEFVRCDVAYPRRQALPPVYALNGAIYLTLRSLLLQSRSFEPPGTVAYEMPPERSLQVDTPWDLRLCDMVLRDRLAQLHSPASTDGDVMPDPGPAKSGTCDARTQDLFVACSREGALVGEAFANADHVESEFRRRSTR